MSFRRLIPYVLIFLVLAGTYVGLKFRQEKQVAQEEQAKKVFPLSEPEISNLSLIRGNDELRLVKKDKEWYLTAPLNTKADQTIVDSMLTTLARLQKERDLGVEQDLKPYGLDKPGMIVKFTAQGQPHQLAIGAKVPGDQNYYARADQNPNLIMISQGSKDSLDRQLLALRDKSLLTFITGEVKGLKIVTGKTRVDLEKTGLAAWRWVGRPDLKVRGDKLDKLIRDLHIARAKNFLEPPPKNLRPLGLVPRPLTEITVVTPQGNQTLLLGAKKEDAVYARKGDGGPIMLVETSLADEITKTLTSLEDRRLWSGAIPQVHQVVWGPPGKTWTAKKNQESWQIIGPGQLTAQQPAARLELALWNFQQIEAAKILPTARTPAGSPAYIVELLDQAGKPLLHLDELGPQGKENLRVATRVGEKTEIALIPRAQFRQWQNEMNRLTTAAKEAAPAEEKNKADHGKQ